MWRTLHSLPGLLAAVFLITIATTGAILSVSPALERSDATIPATGAVSVAQLAGRVVTHYPQTEQIKRLASGVIVVYYLNDGTPEADRVDPLTGLGIGAFQPSPLFRWVKDLHRAFLRANDGRLLSGATAFIMVLMCLSGSFLLARRSGGWRSLLRPLKGAGDRRVHAELARFAVIGLLLSALTGGYMSAVRFGLVPEPTGNEPDYPAEVSGGVPATVTSLKALQETDLNNLHELVFPYPNDPQDVYSLATRQGSGFVDQSTGELLKFQATTPHSRLHDVIVSLHTGEGLWWFGLILGTASLSVPVLSVSGARIWWARRRSTGLVLNNADIATADTVILVGSEHNTTHGFARILHEQMVAAGRRVLTVDMNDLARAYPSASMMFVLTSTYGDGGPPASANLFMQRLSHFHATEGLSFAVLGFGDRQFANYCQFAVEVDSAMSSLGVRRVDEVAFIDRQSPRLFNEWGNRLSKRINVPLSLVHNPKPPIRFEFELTDRADFGVQIHAPTSILRFGPIRKTGMASWLPGRQFRPLPDFEAGDLIGVVPPDNGIPRYYSLASSKSDGLLEICVRKQPGGVCSGLLHNLKTGDRIQGFIQPNPDFRPAPGRHPVILIGAGAGIGPLAGFIRKNDARNPMFLYWGGRNPQSDFLYQPELDRYLEDSRLTGLATAFSRTENRAYVQDRITEDAPTLRDMIERGAQVLVCGGREMAIAVSQVFNDLLIPLGTTVDTLKREGRYLEDVY
ncbi:PepSY domain-containing protein [Saccharospirillum impatiens]|uniref:PepSY domain-containing protein n=1 Tax=Saccharospirillum impatiens TaxID=169438 RepID=UPI0004278E6A|nr:PepSY domain-containing protein [Saccharospirillum impatiens]